jgi:hypothetical protein
MNQLRKCGRKQIADMQFRTLKIGLPHFCKFQLGGGIGSSYLHIIAPSGRFGICNLGLQSFDYIGLRESAVDLPRTFIPEQFRMTEIITILCASAIEMLP